MNEGIFFPFSITIDQLRGSILETKQRAWSLSIRKSSISVHRFVFEFSCLHDMWVFFTIHFYENIVLLSKMPIQHIVLKKVFLNESQTNTWPFLIFFLPVFQRFAVFRVSHL